MKLEIVRKKANHLYSEGQLLVNGRLYIPYTVEHTFSMLPVGTYTMRLVNHEEEHRRLIGICGKNKRPFAFFETGNSFLELKNKKSVLVGECAMPGALKKGKTYYVRLFERMKKCQERQEEMTLTITDAKCESSEPLKHWLTNTQQPCEVQ